MRHLRGRVLAAKSLGNASITARVALADIDDEVAEILARTYTENL